MSSASNYFGNRHSLFKEGPFANNTYRAIVQIAGSSDVVLQWVNFAAAGVATFTIYTTTYDDPNTDLSDTNPASNPRWEDQTANGAVFPSSPTGAIGTSSLFLSPNPGWHHLLVEMVVTTPFPRFALVARGQGRSG